MNSMHRSSRSTPSLLRGSLALALALTVPAACGDDGPAGETEAGETEAGETTEDPALEHLVFLSPEDHLVRVSMALRGVRPSLAELDAVAADPDALGGIVDEYLETPEFGRTIRDMHNESLLSRVDFAIPPAGFLPKGAIAGENLYDLNVSVMDAPLRLIEHVVLNDKPYSEIVTANYTLADGVAATVWGLPYDGDGDSWELSSWPADRGNAGILSDSWLFQRHSSTIANANRGRANMISRALLCQDFLSRDIEIDAGVNLADANEVADAVRVNPTCVSCHQTLDPLASFFSGYFPEILPQVEPYPIDFYIGNLFFDVYGVNMRDPNYYGAAGETLGDVGAFIANDPRFSLCAVRRFYGYFHQLPIADVPQDTVYSLQRSFIDSGLDAKALIRDIVLADAYRVSHAEAPEGEEPPELPPGLGLKKLRPVQLAALVDELTGVQWRADVSDFGFGTIDLVEDGFVGFNVLAGGIDGYFVTHPMHTYNPTASLVLRTIASDAANYVVEHDYAIPDAERDQRRLLTEVGLQDTSEAAVRSQIVHLHARVLGERVAPDSREVDETLELYAAAYADGGNLTNRAWKVVIAAMLQDIKVAFF